MSRHGKPWWIWLWIAFSATAIVLVFAFLLALVIGSVLDDNFENEARAARQEAIELSGEYTVLRVGINRDDLDVYCDLLLVAGGERVFHSWSDDGYDFEDWEICSRLLIGDNIQLKFSDLQDGSRDPWDYLQLQFG